MQSFFIYKMQIKKIYGIIPKNGGIYGATITTSKIFR